MAPAGNWTMLTAAVQAGADAVYFGLDKLNMRAKAENFVLTELNEITTFCRRKKIKCYLTLNTIIYENELSDVDEILSAAKSACVDAVICWDYAVVELCKKHEMPFFISTQGSSSNSLSVNYFKSIGAERVVLARECSLEQIKEIKAKTDLEIEAFVHGAMCIAVSGRCFMSHHLFGISANRGECIQPCRREFEVFDPSIKKSMVIGEDYVLSPKDLCTIEYIDKLIESGIDSFKIEGRKRSPEYVFVTVSAYRKAIDLYFENQLTVEKKKELLLELKTVYNRDFSAGFYFNIPSSGEYASIYGSKATTVKEYTGRVINYYKKAKAAFIEIEACSIKNGDNIYIIGPTTGVIKLSIDKILNEEADVETGVKGEKVTIPCGVLVRPNDKVYLIKEIIEPAIAG
jgi:U32 family peptidase